MHDLDMPAPVQPRDSRTTAKVCRSSTMRVFWRSIRGISGRRQRRQPAPQLVAMSAHRSSVTLQDASKLSKPVSDDGHLALYTHLCCPYAQRSLLTLLEKEADLNIVHVDLASKPNWYSSINPQGLVPAVAFSGQQITESIDICRWADAELPGPSLMPDGPAADGIIAGSSAFASAGLAMVGGRSGGSWSIGQEHTSAQRKAFEKELHKVENAFQKFGGPFLTGSSVSLADLVVWPFMERFLLALQHIQGYRVQEHTSQQLHLWIEAMKARPSSQFASPDEASLLSAFRKHMRLDFFDFHTYDAASLHPHLQGYLTS